MMFHRYPYEANFYPTLSRLPLDLRRKLDLTGITLSLKVWQSFSFAERTVLCHLPCETDEDVQVLTNSIDFLSRRDDGTPVEKIEPLNAALWQPSAAPQAVIERSATMRRAVDLERMVSPACPATGRFLPSSTRPTAAPQRNICG